MRNLSIICITLFLSLPVIAYVHNKSSAGDNLKWSLRENNINLLIDTSSNGSRSYNLNENDIKQIITDSVDQWNGHSNISILSQFVSSLPAVGEDSTLRFTENTAYFGSGVLAVTSISHDPKTGNIFNADILVNESISNGILFTNTGMLSSGSEYAFLGDVITHEVGHLLGLGHSEVIGSTMLYSIFKGQHELAADDIAGLKNIYENSYEKRFKGRVVGGNQVPVFGANVQMILHSTGEVFAAQMTDENGEFYFDDPPSNDYFVIYVNPPKSLTNLPSYYSTVATDYCSGSYRPSFFSKCGGRGKGRPQVFSTSYIYEDLLDESATSNLYDLGDVTIRCDDNIDSQYIYTKYDSTASFKLYSFDQGQYQWNESVGEVFVGTFSETEIEQGTSGKGDVFEVDYTGFENPSGYYLDLRISTESIGSMLELTVVVKRTSDGQTSSYLIETDSSLGKKLLNHNIKHPLSSTPADNHYEITIKPTDTSVLTEQDQEAILAVPSIMKNSDNLYLLMLTLGSNINSSYVVMPPKQYKYPEDNTYCSEGNPAYTSQANISASNNSVAQSQEQNAVVSCATIDIDSDSNSGSGPMSFIFGLVLIFFMTHIRQTLLKILSY